MMPWKVWVAGLVAIGVAGWPGAACAAESAPPPPAAREATLPNGLKVYLAEDHRVPLVAISIIYRVGSGDDPPNAPGTAELFSKILPKLGTRHVPYGAGPLIGASGFYRWNVSASFGVDTSTVRLLVPAAALELALWTEADRMGFGAQGLTDPLISAQREVVIRDQPEKAASNRGIEAMMRAGFGPNHPYNRIGLTPRFDQVTLTGLRDRLHRYYNPGNAAVSLVGDFSSDAALAAIGRLFGALPATSAVKLAAPPNPPPVRGAVAPRVEIAWPTAVPGLELGWRTPRYLTHDDILLDVVARYLRHHIALQFGSATERANSTAQQSSMRRESFFRLYARLSPGQTIDALRAEMLRTVQEVADGHVDEAELALAKTMMRRETANDGDALEVRANYLESCASMKGTPDCFADHLATYAGVSARDLSEVTRKYLTRPPASELLISKDESAPKEGRLGSETALAPLDPVVPPPAPAPPDTPDWYRPPRSPAVARFDMPRVWEAALPGGARLMVMPREGGTIIARVSLNWQSATPTPEVRDLLCWLLTDGTRDPGGTLRQQLSDLGATLSSSANEDSLGLQIVSLPEQLDQALGAVREALGREHFDAPDFKKKQALYVKGLQGTATAATLLERWRRRVGYTKTSRYRYAAVGNEARRAAFEAFAQKDLERFWANERHLDRVTVAFVGALRDSEAVRLGTLALPTWRRTPPTSVAAKSSPVPAGVQLVNAETTEAIRVDFRWPVGAIGSDEHVLALGLSWLSADAIEDGLVRHLQASGWKEPGTWYSNVSSQRDSGALVLSFAVPVDSVPAVFKGVAAHVAALEAGRMPWYAIQDARRETLHWVTTQFASPGACNNLLGVHADEALPANAFEDTYLLARRMDRESLTQAAHLLEPSRARVVVYGSVPGLAEALKGTGFGPVTVVSPQAANGKAL